MPTSSKPRHKHALRADPSTPGQIWVELNELHQACLSKMHSTTAIGGILADPNFANSAVDQKRMALLANQLSTQIPLMKQRVDTIQADVKKQQVIWDNLDTQRKACWKQEDSEGAHVNKDQMNLIEFGVIQLGEQYQTWIVDWTNNILPGFIELMGLMEQTRDAMEKDNNATH